MAHHVSVTDDRGARQETDVPTAMAADEPLPELAFARHRAPRTRAGRVAWAAKMYCLTAPGTTTYLFTLLVTTVALRTASPGVAHRLLVEQSTNLRNLREYPLQVLFTSAFWL